MPLNHENQVQLLADILTNHMEDLGGSVSECEQIGRLIKSLLTNQQVAQDLQPILMDIYQYCQTGKNTQDLTQHINNHQDQLSQWVNDINIYS